jgi:1-acyl-sn-glycerol-3-phosphate acyltransferase
MLKPFGYYINYLWRIIATGIGFSIFGIGAICLVYIVIPLCGKKKAQPIISNSFRCFTFIVESFGLMRFDFKNFDKLKDDHGCLIISNHPTLLDYVLIVSQLKHCDTIVKEALWQNPFLKKIVQLAGYIPNKEFAEIFPLIQQSLVAGNNILIFPEGTRSEPNQPLKLKRGAAQVAVRLGAPIRIIKITCQPSTLTKKNNWYNIPEKKSLFTIEAGELIDAKKFLRDTGCPSLAARRLTKYIEEIMNYKL